MIFNVHYALEILPGLARASLVTLLATVVGIGLALPLGLIVAVVRTARIRPFSWIAAVYVEFIRDTPLLIQLFFLYYVFPLWGIVLPTAVVGLVGLAVYYAAYTSEVFRAGIEGVPSGQWEATVALNFSDSQRWLRIVLPQAIPPTVPSLGNYLIAMFKDTPLLSTIGVQELLGVALFQAGVNYRYFEPLTIVGLLFLVLSWPSALLIRALESKFHAK